MPSAAPTQRTPKTGLLRAWILLPERRKLVLVAAVSVLGFLAFRSFFFTETQETFQVSHVLSSGMPLWHVGSHRVRAGAGARGDRCRPHQAAAFVGLPSSTPAGCARLAPPSDILLCSILGVLPPVTLPRDVVPAHCP